MIRLSIIIPFYNVEQYISECLDSVYNQDIPEEEYEVICVNDASPDNSRDIVLDYQKRHSNLFFVEHEVNKKLGAARNTGRRIARGKYIWNVDSDDMIVPNCLKNLLFQCENNDLDILLFAYMARRDEGVIECQRERWNETEEVISGVAFWKQQVSKKIGTDSQVWTKIFRREFLDNNGIYSPEIYYGEDVPFTFESILRADRIMVINSVCYIYRINTESLTQELKRIPNARSVYENCFVCCYHIDKVLNRIPADKEVRRSLRSVERWIILQYPKLVSDMPDYEVKELRRLCRKSIIKHRFLYRVLSRRQGLEYLGFVFSN